MSFEIRSYLEALEQRLRRLDRERKGAFALWNCRPLLEESEDYLRLRLGDQAIRVLKEMLEHQWGVAFGAGEQSRALLNEAAEVSAGAGWDQETVEEEDLFTNAVAVEAMGCLEKVLETIFKDDAASAALTATGMINRLDYELGMLMGVDDPLEHESMRREIQTQQEALAALETTNELGRKVQQDLEGLQHARVERT